ESDPGLRVLLHPRPVEDRADLPGAGLGFGGRSRRPLPAPEEIAQAGPGAFESRAPADLLDDDSRPAGLRGGAIEPKTEEELEDQEHAPTPEIHYKTSTWSIGRKDAALRSKPAARFRVFLDRRARSSGYREIIYG